MSGLTASDMVWPDKNISSLVLVGDFSPTPGILVQRTEYLTGFPSLFPLPEASTAFIITANDPKFDLRDMWGELLPIDALIKMKDCDAWGGSSGRLEPDVPVIFEPGGTTILCRRLRLNCRGP
ncbi:hypothetical protein B0H16DRAFT_1732247 [Mycena metata]|uniref:Uncharacterized protein n=1 Tax=Mycena metata TaxID=1033252 RepID=A0AAD7I2P2_9AGAR|nr:hypothetical protein B0H16DRAFT_1732247 [Mycena metata]